MSPGTKHMSKNTGSVKLRGTVTSGEGDAKNFISLPGYMEQFQEKLGYKPYPGTLNIQLDEQSIPKRADLDEDTQITIEEWEQDGNMFGAVFCFLVSVSAASSSASVDDIHAIYPDRTDHDLGVLELIAPVNLRDRLEVDDGDRVSVDVDQ